MIYGYIISYFSPEEQETFTGVAKVECNIYLRITWDNLVPLKYQKYGNNFIIRRRDVELSPSFTIKTR